MTNNTEQKLVDSILWFMLVLLELKVFLRHQTSIARISTSLHVPVQCFYLKDNALEEVADTEVVFGGRFKECRL